MKNKFYLVTIILGLSLGRVVAQQTNTFLNGIIRSGTNITGTCRTGGLYIHATTGALYNCPSATHVWTLVSSGSGTGSVTSVDLSVPSILVVSGNPITDAGTLAVTLATETANRIFAGPTSGGAATPTFRSLVAADLPTITSLGTISSGVWNGTVITGQYGGTGVANTGSTITLAGNLVTSGANSLTFTTTGATNVTLPTTGTVATLAGSEAFTNKTGNISQWTNNSNYLTAITGGTCTNQAVTAISTAGAPTCTTLTSSYTSGLATTAGDLSQFASTTSAQLATLISNETGSGA